MALTAPAPDRMLMAERVSGRGFVATNPTPGTGLATIATPTAFSETQYTLTVKNTDQTGGVDIVPDYLKLVCTAAGTAGASVHLTVTLDNDVANVRWTSGGSVLTQVPTNGKRGDVGVAVIHAGALVTVAGPAKRIVSNSVFRTVIPVVGDTYILSFADPMLPGGVAPLNGTNPSLVVLGAPAVVVPPQWALCFGLWLPSQSAASSWEVEFGYFEE